MRLQTILGYGAGVLAFCQLALSTPLGSPEEPEVVAVAAFPEENAFGHVVNGERNSVLITIENKSDRNVTLQSIGGSFHHPESNALVKNTTATPVKLPLLEGTKLEIPYTFYSEFRTGDLRLNIWVDHVVDDVKYRVAAYDSVVKIVEPEGSILDFKLWITYLIVLGLMGGLGYYAYVTFVPQPKKRRAPVVSAPVTVTATGAGGYQEEWIPEHHLKKAKGRKTKNGVATSGDETSGAELSNTEGKKKKGKK